MLKRLLLLLVLGLVSLPVLAQDNVAQDSNAQNNNAQINSDPAPPANPAPLPETYVGYIACPYRQSNVFLYRNVKNFDVVGTPRCDDKVEVFEKVDTLGGYLHVRTADGKDGYVPQDLVTKEAPKLAIAVAPPPPPAPVPAAQGSRLAGPLSSGPSNYGYDIPKAELFGGYSYLSADWETMASRSGMHGWNGSAGINVFPWLGVEGGMSGHRQSNCVGAAGLSCTILTVTGGPKISYRHGSSITAFGHGLVGLGSLTMGLSGSSLSYRSLAYGMGGGVDYALTDHISVRVGQVDYVRAGYLKSLGGTHENNIRISGGVVFRLGKVITE